MIIIAASRFPRGNSFLLTALTKGSPTRQLDDVIIFPRANCRVLIDARITSDRVTATFVGVVKLRAPETYEQKHPINIFRRTVCNLPPPPLPGLLFPSAFSLL